MRLRASILILCYALGVSTANAEIVPVRAGAHAGFTRIVFDLPNGTDWSLDQSGEAPVVRLTGRAKGFDLSATFRKITRTRLQSVTTLDAQSAQLDLACDCTVEAFVLRDRMLVVDITGDNAPELNPGDVVMRIDPRYFRPAEVETLLGDPAKAKALLAEAGFADGFETTLHLPPPLVRKAPLRTTKKKKGVQRIGVSKWRPCLKIRNTRKSNSKAMCRQPLRIN